MLDKSSFPGLAQLRTKRGGLEHHTNQSEASHSPTVCGRFIAKFSVPRNTAAVLPEPALWYW